MSDTHTRNGYKPWTLFRLEQNGLVGCAWQYFHLGSARNIRFKELCFSNNGYVVPEHQ
jgi:hypothetical protein